MKAHGGLTRANLAWSLSNWVYQGHILYIYLCMDFAMCTCELYHVKALRHFSMNEQLYYVKTAVCQYSKLVGHGQFV